MKNSKKCVIIKKINTEEEIILNKGTLKTFLTALGDAVLSNAAIFITLLVFSFESQYEIFYPVVLLGLPILSVIIVAVYYLFDVYRTLWQFVRALDVLKICVATVFSYLIFMGLHIVVAENILQTARYSFVVYLCGGLLGLILILAYRFFLGMMEKTSSFHLSKKGKKYRVMIIGGGSAGDMLLKDMKSNEAFDDCCVVCIIDDDPAKLGRAIDGVKVVGNRDTIVENAKKYSVNRIIFAIPTCPPIEKAKILEICTKAGCEVKLVPSLDRIIEGTAKLSSVRKINIEDLLGRDPIKVDLDSIMNYVENKVILVTGGGGSIGSELCRQLAKHNPKKLVIFDIYENNAYDILNELKAAHPELDVTALIGSVRDTVRLEEVFSEIKPQIVYHAAAHKHVPLMEDSPREAIKNNVFGTQNLVNAADRHGVEKFLLISTDKAVNPTNIMGASKRICEMIVQSCSRHSKTEFMIVRFGNVLGSNGSVIPLFEKQIENGGPVTVTDKRIIRYFMTIPEAVSLVLQAGALAKGGEIFVLDMGEPMKILDLAENLIRLSGYEPYTEMPIEFTGLRPGEKLYEELLMAEEGLQDTENKLIHIGKPIIIDEERFSGLLEELRKAAFDGEIDIRAAVKNIVSTYNPQ